MNKRRNTEKKDPAGGGVRRGPKKQLGQHFLTSPAYARKIARAIPAAAHERVLEIGPGRGALTMALKERFQDLHCVEIDDEVLAVLAGKLGPGAGVIHHHDVLSFDYAHAGFPLHVTGNLPYAIGALIVKKTLLYGTAILSMTVMLQREVARRIVARPHSKENGFLSLFCQFFGEPEILFHVPPGAFFPRPNVHSSVIRMTIDPAKCGRLDQGQWNDFFAFVSRGFSQRRKKLANVLGRDANSKSRAESILSGLGCTAAVRPEDLGINEWLALFREWYRCPSP
ncbi:MAG: ribosomal RNA small subunit methyltransferase A [Chitinispirillaceae bacterium]|nr:ribosomal RNA small subunit methyltransferase A [Chitinispirillaceae bacterium]